ncbi:hypothetical protein GCM10025867_50930 (plasmid) [Frondihabitans sucicola]|uniref:DUF222 domain-containing protein n=1 Tax=Frondihabitans sucicola TaxID=1268041 RepID=A0ABN6Y675_9MICO|nr:hypothetical protein [Frondihabitans sucicola]BDZ52852.1 hypothetical protein GCM10025867_50930 [Frondihabitans sucicola]
MTAAPEPSTRARQAVLQVATINAIRSLQVVSENQRTATYREIAGLLIDARATFPRADGSPDWLGRTYAYKQFVGSIYRASIEGMAAMVTIPANIRYHVGNVIRERLDAETIEQYGLDENNPRQRALEGRRQHRTEFDRLLAMAQRGEGDASVSDIVMRFADELDALTPELVRDLSNSDRAAIRAAIGPMMLRLGDLRAAAS